MKKTIFTLLTFTMAILSFGQNNYNNQLIKLGKSYKDYMFRNEPNKNFIKELKTNVPENLIMANDFIVQTITTKNKILSQPYISRPDDAVLKQIFIIQEINQNYRREDQIDNNKLIDSLQSKEIPTYELVDNYYDMLFTAVGNKNQPFNLSKNDFKLNSYNLKDETEKGIFFLQCMSYCGTSIWGYINIPKPANTKTALEYINKFPKFNGQPYYQYTDFYFKDFEMLIITDNGKESYKGYYINKYYETLLNHLFCLIKEESTEKEKNNLLLGSILKDSNLYKYTKLKDTLEQIFEAKKRD
ncbi:MAG TPA: hypothetical protein VK164_04840 [Flavobacterium sp.]|uniref:hypothetical protein n=1 Tax=Flavobacterium sp. TaxID=239 RepID=UPI002B4B78C5|nr:hypothetical protein [Flavobacterium sp.]HLO73243.1 hypothetical protein [Flavobacterium sp.]